MIKEGYDAGIHDAIVDAGAVAQTADDTLVGQALKLIGHSLRRHADSFSELRDGQPRVQNQGVQEAQPRPAGKYLEGTFKCTRVGHGQQRPLGDRPPPSAAALRRRLGRARGTCGNRTGIYGTLGHSFTITQGNVIWEHESASGLVAPACRAYRVGARLRCLAGRALKSRPTSKSMKTWLISPFTPRSRSGVWFAGASFLFSVIAVFYLGFEWSQGLRIDPTNAAQVEAGRRIYMEACASCHGASLEGQPNWRKRLPNGRLPAPPNDASGHTWEHPYEALFRAVKYGPRVYPAGYQTDMPAFENRLTDSEIAASLAFIASTWPSEIRAKRARMDAHPQRLQ